ncbi:MAG: VOC family protein [Candidatus Hydrogenedentes bacterium]|nr:VOC family protein [Candidatus Hydrogenedentota bacterium]
MITHIATIAVYVEDQTRAERFWTEQVGFEVKRKDRIGNNGYWLEVGPKGERTNLVLYPKSMARSWNQYKSSIVLQCHDFDGTYEHLKRKGVPVREEPKRMQGGTYVHFRDPDGNEFLLKGDR